MSVHAASSAHAVSCPRLLPWLLPPGLGVSLGPRGGSPTHVASRAATEAGCPGALGVPVSRREQAHGRVPRGEAPKHLSPVDQQRLLHAEQELWFGPQPVGPAPGSVSGCTRPAVSGSTVGTCRGNVSAPGHSPLGPSWLPAPMPRGTHAAQVPHSAGLCFLFPHQVGASGDKGAALVRALQRPRQGRCRRSRVRQGSPHWPRQAWTHVLHTAMVWHASPVQNSEMVLYCRFTWWKNVVAAKQRRRLRASPWCPSRLRCPAGPRAPEPLCRPWAWGLVLTTEQRPQPQHSRALGGGRHRPRC